jgi:beta-glucanase (GH16 family)
MPTNVIRSALLSLLLVGGCAPIDDTGPGDTEDTDTRVRPTDLTLTVTLVGADGNNPYGDGSGVVQLRATANDAVRFTLTIDDGDPFESPTGEAEHTFEAEGTASHTFTATAFAESGASASVSETVTVYRSYAAFPTLVWADEFDGSGSPDPDKWHHQVIPPIDGGWFNGELQHYTDRTENSRVSDGTLKIVALRETYTTHSSTRSFTSARLNSKFAFTYGRVEVRAKLPAEAGTWPAIWTLGANVDEIGNYHGAEYGSVGWPACGEIDIMEQTGWDKDTTIAHFHWGDTNTGAYDSDGGEIRNRTSTTDFHVYSLTWTESSLAVFVDGDLVHELDNTRERPFDNPHYLLLNVAMGGNLGGSVPGDFTRATLEIDYVRVFQ